MALNGNANPVYKLTDAAPDDYARREPVRRRVMVSIPSHGGNPSYITQSSFLRSRDLANSLGITLDINVRVGDSSIERARDIMFSQFLDKYPDATDLMFIDDDIGWEAEGLIRLLSHQVDFVGGAYRSRGDPEVYVLRSRDNELQRDKATGLMDVEGVPTGFLYITRRAAEKLAAAQVREAEEAKVKASRLVAFIDQQMAPDDAAEELKRLVLSECESKQQYWYTDCTAPGLTIRHLFEFKVREHRLYSEDYNFCLRWIALGEKCWLDPDQNLHHVGAKVFSGNLMRWLESSAPKIPDHVPKGEAAAHFANPLQGSLLDAAKALIGRVA